MAQPANILDRYDQATDGDTVHEDLSDVIYNISPTETPFVSNVGRGSTDNTYKEWLIDALADAADTPHIDGDEWAADALNAPDRLGNYCQITRKDLLISGRAEAVNTAGRRSEVAYQVAKAGQEIKRDIELISTSRKVCGERVWDHGDADGGLPGVDSHQRQSRHVPALRPACPAAATVRAIPTRSARTARTGDSPSRRCSLFRAAATTPGATPTS